MDQPQPLASLSNLSGVARLCLTLLAGLTLAAGLVAQPLAVLAYETEPFLFRDEAGELTGLEFEILEFYAKSKNRTLEVELVDDFDAVLSRLASGDGDLASATLTVTPEREKAYDFSASYFPVRVVLVETRGRGTKDLADLAGQTVATMRGTTYEELVSGIPNAKLVYGDDERDLVLMVADGKAQATAIDSAIAFTVVPEHLNLEMGLPLSEEQQYAFAVREGDPLAAELSKHIGQLKTSGIYYRLLEKYLGKEAVEVVRSARQ